MIRATHNFEAHKNPGSINAAGVLLINLVRAVAAYSLISTTSSPNKPVTTSSSTAMT